MASDARAALERLRDEFARFFAGDEVFASPTGSEPAGRAYNQACRNHATFVGSAINRELAALPDEPEPAAGALVEAVAHMVACWDAETLGVDAWPQVGPRTERAVREALAAERARKPDDRDATIAELREKLAKAEAAAEYASGYQADLTEIAMTMDRLGYPCDCETMSRMDPIGRLKEMWSQFVTMKERAEKAEAALRQRESDTEKLWAEARPYLEGRFESSTWAGIIKVLATEAKNREEHLRVAMDEAQHWKQEARTIAECEAGWQYQLAAARKEGLRELREQLSNEQVWYSVPGIRREIDRLLADPAPEPAAEQGDDGRKFDAFAAIEAIRTFMRAVEECVAELRRRGGGA